VGLGELLNRAHVNVSVTTTNEAGAILGSDVFTITDGLVPSWAASPYRGAMNLPGAWRAAIIAADLLGSFPWEAYERGPLGVDVLASDQPPLLTQPAPPDAGITTVSSFGLDYIWHGNAVALKGPLTPEGDVSVLAPVPIANVAIGRSNGHDLDGFRRGEVGYRIGNHVYHADQVLHLKGPCEPGALRGLGALEVHLAGSLRTALELQRQAGQLDISGVPTGTLKVTAPDLTEDEAALIKSRWLASQSSRTVAVLNDITEFTPLAWNPTETQLLEARKFSLHEIALIVGVPLYFLGVETSNRTYSNVEQEGIVLTRFHLAGAIRRMEAAYTGCMRPGRHVLADLSDALRADTLTRYQAWQIGAAAGFLTPNEIRAREGLAPIPGGDELVQPALPGGPNPATKPDTGPPEIGEGEHEQGRVLDEDELGPAEFAAVLDVWLAEETRARGGGDPDGSNLKTYWTTGAGRARWNSWTELYQHLLKHLSPDRAKRTASQWFHDVKGFWPGDKRNRSAQDALSPELRGRHSAYDPDQPRWPEGTPGVAGQWKGDGGSPLAPSSGGGRHRFEPPQQRPLTANTGGAPAKGRPAPSAAVVSTPSQSSNSGDSSSDSSGDDVTLPKPGDVVGQDAEGRPIVVGVDGGQGVLRPDVPKRDGYGGGKDGEPRYRLNKRKFCPTCGGKAQDPQPENPKTSTGVVDWTSDGEPLYEPGYEPESCDEPTHDKSDPDYEAD